jgi:hypothetical protein
VINTILLSIAPAYLARTPIANHSPAILVAYLTSISSPTPTILDTGRTNHLVPHDDWTVYKSKTGTPRPRHLLPSGATNTSMHLTPLNIPSLPSIEARQCHLLPDFTMLGSLISLGQQCDYRCSAPFTATTVIFQHNGATVLGGSRTPPSGLWLMQTPTARALPPKPCAMLHSATQQSHQLMADGVALYHTAMFSPPLSTWCAAIDAGYMTGPHVRPSTTPPPFFIPAIQRLPDQQRANLRPS